MFLWSVAFRHSSRFLLPWCKRQDLNECKHKIPNTFSPSKRNFTVLAPMCTSIQIYVGATSRYWFLCKRSSFLNTFSFRRGGTPRNPAKSSTSSYVTINSNLMSSLGHPTDSFVAGHTIPTHFWLNMREQHGIRFVVSPWCFLETPHQGTLRTDTKEHQGVWVLQWLDHCFIRFLVSPTDQMDFDSRNLSVSVFFNGSILERWCVSGKNEPFFHRDHPIINISLDLLEALT